MLDRDADVRYIRFGLRVVLWVVRPGARDVAAEVRRGFYGDEEDVDVEPGNAFVDARHTVHECLLLGLLCKGSWGVVEDPERHDGDDGSELGIWGWDRAKDEESTRQTCDAVLSSKSVACYIRPFVAGYDDLWSWSRPKFVVLFNALCWLLYLRPYD